MSDADGWLEVAKLDLNQRVGKPDPRNATFEEIAQSWLELGKTKTGEPKDHSTKYTDNLMVTRYLLPLWGKKVAKDLQPLEIQNGLDQIARGTRSKLRNVMSAIYSHGQKYGLIPRGEEFNPMPLVSAPCSTDYEAIQLSGKEAVLLIEQLEDPLLKTLVTLLAITGLRISEAVALQWSSIDWWRGRIRITRKFAYGDYGKPKSKMSGKPIEMTEGLAAVLQAWRRESLYAADSDLVFPSYRLGGKSPRCASMVAKYIRAAARAAGVLTEEDGRHYYCGELVRRFGCHNLRHGMGTWLAENGTSPEVIQRMLRHSTKQMTEHYLHPKAREAQQKYIAELGIAHNGDTLRVQ